MLREYTSIRILARPIYTYVFVRFVLAYLCSMKSIAVKTTGLVETLYCRFGNFREIFISRIFNSRLIGEFLNSPSSIQFIKIKLSKI